VSEKFHTESKSQADTRIHASAIGSGETDPHTPTATALPSCQSQANSTWEFFRAYLPLTYIF